MTETPSLLVGLERLREQAYDVVVIDRDASDRPATDLLLAIHASTHQQQAVLILADGGDRLEATDYLMAGANAYLSLHQTTTQELVWQMHSAVLFSRQQVENIRLRARQQRYGEQEQREVLSLLEEQATIFRLASRPGHEPDRSSAHVTEELTQDFQELLQAYIVMGRGNIGTEVTRLADRIRDASCSIAEILNRFTIALESLVRDRGTRSARHVFNRGNLLLLDLMLTITDRVPLRKTHEHHDCDSHL